MNISVKANRKRGVYQDPTLWQNSTLRYVPPVDFPEFLETRVGKVKVMRVWITLDEYWDYRTGITYHDYEIGKMRYPVEQLHYPYDMSVIVPAPSGTRFADYLKSHSEHAQELLLNVRRYEREVSDGIITMEQYEEVFRSAVEYCKELAPNIRYIECCNEVDIKTFGMLTAEEYVAIYLTAHKVVRELNEKHHYPIPLQIGGFAQAHPLQGRQLMEDVMTLLKASEIGGDPMDFYAYHMYNAPENRSLTAHGMTELTELSGVEKLRMIVTQHERLIEKLELPKRPVFLDEVGRARATGLDGDALHNAAGVLNYLIAFSKGVYGEAYPFPWCTFHNPNLQISYTQYILREDGTYAATPNGIAMEMLHRIRGDMVATEVTNFPGTDGDYCALAVRGEKELWVLAVNNFCDSLPARIHVEGLEEGVYRAEMYRCNLFANNVVYKRGQGTGELTVTEVKETSCREGELTFTEILDRDCFVLCRIMLR